MFLVTLLNWTGPAVKGVMENRAQLPVRLIDDQWQFLPTRTQHLWVVISEIVDE